MHKYANRRRKDICCIEIKVNTNFSIDVCLKWFRLNLENSIESNQEKLQSQHMKTYIPRRKMTPGIIFRTLCTKKNDTRYQSSHIT